MKAMSTVCRERLKDCVNRLIVDLRQVFRADKRYQTPSDRLNEARKLIKLARDLLSVPSPPLPLELLLELESVVEEMEDRSSRFAKTNRLVE